MWTPRVLKDDDVSIHLIIMGLSKAWPEVSFSSAGFKITVCNVATPPVRTKETKNTYLNSVLLLC